MEWISFDMFGSSDVLVLTTRYCEEVKKLVTSEEGQRYMDHNLDQTSGTSSLFFRPSCVQPNFPLKAASTSFKAPVEAGALSFDGTQFTDMGLS